MGVSLKTSVFSGGKLYPAGTPATPALRKAIAEKHWGNDDAVDPSTGGVDAAEVEALKGELRQAVAENEQLRGELEEARREVARLTPADPADHAPAPPADPPTDPQQSPPTKKTAAAKRTGNA